MSHNVKIGKYLVKLQDFKCGHLWWKPETLAPCISGTLYFLEPKIFLIFFYP